MPDAREQAEAVAKFMDRKWCGSPTCDGTCLPDYANSLDAMREVEDEIERRGLWRAYRSLLHMAVIDRGFALWESEKNNGVKYRECLEYAVATATPAERLEALGKVMEEATNG